MNPYDRRGAIVWHHTACAIHIRTSNTSHFGLREDRSTSGGEFITHQLASWTQCGIRRVGRESIYHVQRAVKQAENKSVFWVNVHHPRYWIQIRRSEGNFLGLQGKWAGVRPSERCIRCKGKHRPQIYNPWLAMHENELEKVLEWCKYLKRRKPCTSFIGISIHDKAVILLPSESEGRYWISCNTSIW